MVLAMYPNISLLFLPTSDIHNPDSDILPPLPPQVDSSLKFHLKSLVHKFDRTQRPNAGCPSASEGARGVFYQAFPQVPVVYGALPPIIVEGQPQHSIWLGLVQIQQSIWWVTLHDPHEISLIRARRFPDPRSHYECSGCQRLRSCRSSALN